MSKSLKLALASILLSTIGIASLPTCSSASIDIATPQHSATHIGSNHSNLIARKTKKKAKVKKSKKTMAKSVGTNKKKSTNAVKPQAKPSPTSTTDPTSNITKPDATKTPTTK